jgi:sugar lactone lactonase YvrE
MWMNRPIPVAILIIACFELPSRTVSAHPSSGIVVDEQGQVFFQDILGHAIWKIDAHGKLTKYDDKLGGHRMALDVQGSFSRADLKLFKRITPFGSKPTLLVADGGAPIVVDPDGNLYYGHSFLDDGGVAVGLTRISAGGSHTLFSPDLKKTLERMDDGVFGLATGPDGSVYISTWDSVLRVNQDGTVSTVAHPVVVKDCDADPADHKPSGLGAACQETRA